MARLALAKASRAEDPELQRSLLQVLRIASATLGVARVGIWEIASDWTRIDCRALYEQPSERFSSGLALELAAFPAYAAALKERRVIAAENAHQDPRTRELESTYLSLFDIGAMLDCPIYDSGEVIAILCHEHVGAARTWSKRDADFAVNVADVLSTLFAQSARARYESELRVAREALAEARVMDSLGRMAARVAHDFNNTLMGISLSVSVVARDNALDAQSQSALTDCRDLIDQGTRLVRQLLAFARSGGNEGHKVDLCGTIAEMLPRLRRLLGADITLDCQVPNECALVPLDLASIEQVLMNLVLNARDALPGGGAIHLTAELSEKDVVLRVRDNGVGMDGETRQRIFEPYFTTKGERGSGLGLAIVFGALRHAGGSIEVQSEPGRGSTFTLRFPRVSP
ncbi:MAG: sensor histidine kinase [Myxococcota bacterium]